jgi:hypothetical protein
MVDTSSYNLRKIEVKKNDVIQFTNQNKEYSEIFGNSSKIKINKNKESELSVNFYICKIEIENEKNHFTYFGFLNKEFYKNYFGRITYPNMDFYSGQLKDDYKNGMGIYNYHEKGFFVGKWEKNSKKEGIYIWNSENKKQISVFIGYFCDGYYNKGLYISTKNILNNTSQSKIKFIYFGEFDKYGKKNSDNSFLYEVEKLLLFYGSIKDDKVISGYYYQLTSSESENNLEQIKKNIIYFETNQNEDNSIKEVCKNPALDLNDIERISKFISIFITLFIVKKDWNEKIQKFYEKSKSFSTIIDKKTSFSEHVNLQIENFKRYLKPMDNINKFISSLNTNS